MYLLGIDVGSSSVKAMVLHAPSGRCVASAFFPETELRIDSPQPGFAEQDPQDWYDCAKAAVRQVMRTAGLRPEAVQAVGLAYQMHGLVCVDKNRAVLRPAILWCDSRAVPTGQAAFEALGAEKCLGHLLNSPGNFTGSKLAWVKENEPEIFARIDQIMLPGDWLAMRLTGEVHTTAGGLSEGMLWDFAADVPAGFLLEHFGLDPGLLPTRVPTFGIQSVLTATAASEFGLSAGTPVAYRAGDQPNNAFSLKVLNPGEVAATAGTSGVVYGVTAVCRADPQQRVNTFAHVNHSPQDPRLGVLLCVNGAGSLQAWMRRMLGGRSYAQMDELAATVPCGSGGLTILPFGNGAERMLGNRAPGAQLTGIDFNRHTPAHLIRAMQEGVAFSFLYGMEAMAATGLEVKALRAGFANLFRSPVFCETLAGVRGMTIELYETDGAQGAARGAGLGAGIYCSLNEAFESLKKRREIFPKSGPYAEAFAAWRRQLDEVFKPIERQP
jgi:xylulokinase